MLKAVFARDPPKPRQRVVRRKPLAVIAAANIDDVLTQLSEAKTRFAGAQSAVARTEPGSCGSIRDGPHRPDGAVAVGVIGHASVTSADRRSLCLRFGSGAGARCARPWEPVPDCQILHSMDSDILLSAHNGQYPAGAGMIGDDKRHNGTRRFPISSASVY